MVIAPIEGPEEEWCAGIALLYAGETACNCECGEGIVKQAMTLLCIKKGE